MADQYKVIYFDARGAAEPLRLILSAGGAKFEDVRFPVSMPPTIPADIKARAPYGQVPLLEINGQIMSQSMASARYLAKKFNLAGSNDLESARCDEVVDAVKDMLQFFTPLYREQDEAKKAEIKAKATEDSKTRFLNKFNELLEANGGHFVGKSVTWADICVVHAVDNLDKMYALQLTEGFPAVKKLVQTVYNTPGIKEWVAKRPDTPF